MKMLSARTRRLRRVRRRIQERSDRMRLSVFRSNKYIYAQVIDDKEHRTIASESDPTNLLKKGPKSERAFRVGERLGAKLMKLKVKAIVLDRGMYKYAGRVRALAEGVIASGIKI